MKKTLIQFLYESGIETRMPHVYLDMDGVLVDLEKGAFKVHGANLGDVPKPERWDKINTIKDFWKNLESSHLNLKYHQMLHKQFGEN